MNFAKQYFWIKQNLHEAHHNTLPFFFFTKVYFRCIWVGEGFIWDTEKENNNPAGILHNAAKDKVFSLRCMSSPKVCS